MVILFGFNTKIIHGQTCANAINIYTFTAAGINYEIVKELKTWTVASACAVTRGGYLVQVDDQTEQTAVYNAIVASGIPTNYHSVSDGGSKSYVWIGATDKNTEGVWLWDGNNDNTGTNFWNGQGAAGLGTGSVVGTNYVNFGGKTAGTIKEPDDYLSNQDCAGICLTSWPYGIAGEWNDLASTNTLYYVIEYPASTKVIENDLDNIIQLFPNPTKGMVEIKSNIDVKEISISDVNGKVIKTLTNDKSIDMSHLSKGVYFLNVTTKDDKVIIKKVVKE